MATAILSRVSRRPHWVLLANMLVATFLSMFISNVAAPVLSFGLVQPILRTYAAGELGLAASKPGRSRVVLAQ